jgi:pilus assembly protein CpaF
MLIGDYVTSAIAIVEHEVRELVRRRSIDPLLAPAEVRELVADVVADYSDRAGTSSLPAINDPDGVAGAVFDTVAGFGPLQGFFNDPAVEEIWINEPGRVFVARRGRAELTTVVLTSERVGELVERMLRVSGRRLDLSIPFVDAQLPDGSRLHVAIPPITARHMAVNIASQYKRIGGILPRCARFNEIDARGRASTPASPWIARAPAWA